MTSALASAAAQARHNQAQLADAARAIQQSLRPQLSVINKVADTMGRFQRDHAAVIRAVADQMSLNRTLASQIAEATRPMRALSQVVGEVFRPIREMEEARRRMLDACLKPLQDAQRLREQMVAEMCRPLRAMAEARQAMIADAMRPLQEAASLHQKELRDVVRSLQARWASVAGSLRDYRPDVQTQGDALVIDGKQYTPDAIQRIEDELVFGQEGVLAKSPAQVAWEQIPPAARWVIQAILSALIAMILQCMIFGMPERPLAQAQHERKTEVRQLLKDTARRSDPKSICPFINSEYLRVHVAPNRRSKVIDVLSYPQEVTITEYRRKKRWIRIEWQDSVTGTKTGWVLGRYVFRMPGYPATLGGR